MFTTRSTITPAATRIALVALVAAVVLGLAPGRAAALTATVGFTPAAPATGASVTFTADALPDLGQTVTSFAWSFGDGTVAATDVSPVHTFAAAGTYTVSLTVTEEAPLAPPVTTTVTRVVTVNTPPSASFTIAPPTPLPDGPITLTSTATDPDGQIVAWAWDLDNDGKFDDAFTPVATTAFPVGGNHPVSLRVTDDLGATATVRRNVVVDKPPVAAFTVSPAAPLAGQTVTFRSTSTDADGTIVAQDWDLSGNGLFTDANGATATKRFARSGDAIIRLRVTDNRGATSIAVVTVPVGGPPIASFGFSPSAPVAGRPITFTSTSRDLDGAIAAQQWDLDGNGVFNDAAGGVVQNTFPFPGIYTVALRVTDTSALSDVAFQSVVVSAPAGAAAPAPRAGPGRRAQLLLPFPIVRIAGRVTGRWTHIVLLEVRAPADTRVRVACKGRGCPKRALTAVVQRRVVRFAGMRRRLIAGSVVQVYVRANGRVGKYTRFTIRRSRAPLRRDMCLPPTRRGLPAPCTA